MGVNGSIECPTEDCAYTSWARLGAGEEGLWGEYRKFAQAELKAEHPNHADSGPWKFVKSPEWARVEKAYYTEEAAALDDDD